MDIKSKTSSKEIASLLKIYSKSYLSGDVSVRDFSEFGREISKKSKEYKLDLDSDFISLIYRISTYATQLLAVEKV